MIVYFERKGFTNVLYVYFKIMKWCKESLAQLSYNVQESFVTYILPIVILTQLCKTFVTSESI